MDNKAILAELHTLHKSKKPSLDRIQALYEYFCDSVSQDTDVNNQIIALFCLLSKRF